MKFEICEYTLRAPVKARIALLSDLHGRDVPGLEESLKEKKPDAICLCGDMMEQLALTREDSLVRLSRLPRIARTFYATGNHDADIPREEKKRLERAGVEMLDAAMAQMDDIWLAGLPSGGDAEFARRFSEREGYKILLCHHPEYYRKLGLVDLPIQLILSGHAHGGQWRIGRRGVYAPGQGLLPRYTGGVYDGRLVVSRGLSNTTRIPRIHNALEWTMIELDGMGER